MAENLRKLVSNKPLRSVQDKLELWLRAYETNSCDQNLNICLELIEQVAKVQGQLFGILTTTAQEGRHYEIIKSRLLPWLEASFTAASLGKPVDSKVLSPQDMFDEEKQKESGVQDWDMQQLDAKLNSTHNQFNQVQDDLAETEKLLEETKNRSAISLLVAEEEINQLRKQLKSLQDQETRHRNSERTGSTPRSTEQRVTVSRGLEPGSSDQRSSEPRRSEQRRSEKQSSDKRSTEVANDYEKQLQTLKDEIAILSAEKSVLQGRSTRSRPPSPVPRSGSRSGSGSPSTAVVKIRTPSPNRARLSSVARKAALLSRFNDAYSQARLDAQCLLRRCFDEAETVQRIIYIATVEAFHVAKMAFRHFKICVRKSLTPSYVGSNDFEDAVSDYIICHLDLYDSQGSVNDVIQAMNINAKISFPPGVDFCLLSTFIQEICCIAFAMQTLEPPLDIAFGADGEIFNDCKRLAGLLLPAFNQKERAASGAGVNNLQLASHMWLFGYRRSYDSDFTAPLVFYHVWPALMENDTVIMKGEAVTKRGAFVWWPCIVKIHPKCLIHKFENIYKPRDFIKEVHKELFDKISYKGEEKDWLGRNKFFSLIHS